MFCTCFTEPCFEVKYSTHVLTTYLFAFFFGSSEGVSFILFLFGFVVAEGWFVPTLLSTVLVDVGMIVFFLICCRRSEWNENCLAQINWQGREYITQRLLCWQNLADGSYDVTAVIITLISLVGIWRKLLMNDTAWMGCVILWQQWWLGTNKSRRQSTIWVM